LKNEVLVSFSLTPATLSALSALFIASEFAFKAAFAVLFVVSTDNESVTLSGFTIVCVFPEDGLIATNGTVINLNGWGIYGPGVDSSKAGIAVAENNVVVNGPGIISEFQAGILATEARNISARSITLQDNEIGVFLTRTNVSNVSENIINKNNIAIGTNAATNTEISNNLMGANTLAGISLVRTDNTVVHGNNIQGSENGIFVDSQSIRNTIQSNNLHDNIVDINNANGLSPLATQNTFDGNDCRVSYPSGICFGR
jgi:parallel beta-helix repeat protein